MKSAILGKIFSFFVILLSLIVLFSSNSNADTYKPSGLVVSPAILQLKLNKNQNQLEFNIDLTNSSKSIIRINVGAKDFTSLNDQGGISFVPQSLNNSHGLIGNIAFANRDLILAPNQSLKVPVTLNNLNDLSPGGYYSAITFTQEAQPNSDQNNISINQTVDTLLFLQTYNSGQVNLSFTPPRLSFFELSIPSQLNMIFNNLGNTQVVPRGVVRLQQSNGLLLYQSVINEDSDLILPSSSRLFSFNLLNIHKPIFFQKYKLSIAYRNSGQKDYSLYSYSFIYINKLLVISVVVILLIFIGLIFRHIRNNKKQVLIKN